MNEEKTICFRCSSAQVSECGRFLIIFVSFNSNDMVYFAPLPESDEKLDELTLIPIDKQGDASFDVRLYYFGDCI